ncbi:hypothetical protein TGAM01_v205792 [Trichoderma gamsii]|uniref:Nephrocystin 3-like N-terminal domain-containing protein n=1 Tax=Trichoderma gamsii TaxID=398673 RepID=A0A2P4ZMI6_9HYPO|nr:hypothetical protein TGAM01_v205792 [Trichoderma gamsii]PON25498.1 hypothetical protein TGAM01_v205792 [Trichoderma gamsii]
MILFKMAELRQFSENTVGDNASIFQGNIANMTNNFEANHAAADESFLQKFSKTNPIDNKNRILESKGGLLDDSYRWILEHEQFRKWRDTENSGVLWIKGDPGKGKTMLLCGIIKELENDPKIQERLAYFFCQATDDKINTSTAIIRGLSYLYLRQYPKLLSRIRQENKDEPDDFLEGDNERFALCRIFKSVVKDPCITHPICIIDALDECQHEESLQALFSLIVDTSSRVKWLLSSRNEKWIERGLRAVKEHQRLTLELRGNSEHVSSAVKTYISHCIQDIHALKDDAELRHKTAEVLHTKANGTFLWVTLVVKELHNTSHPHVEAVLQSMPEGLKELYDEILRRAKKRWKADERACLAILATVTAAKRPLSMEELHMFISPTLMQLEGKYNIHSVKGFVEACGSFISNTNDVIYFIHQSVKDYMGKQEASQILELTSDLCRAVSQNRTIIDRVPTQLYVSALVFSPVESRLRKTFEAAELPEWMAIKPVMGQEWGHCLQTIEGPFRTIFVTFSPDNSKLVSTDFLSIATVWDLTTGALLQQLHGSMYAPCAAFSSDGNTLALRHSEGVEIWDLVGGSRSKKINHTGITSMTFIAEGTYLSMLGPKLFTTHDIARSVDLHTYVGQPGEKFHDVVLSSSFVQLAFSDIKDRVEAWSLAVWTLVPYFTNKTFGARLVVTLEGENSTLLKVMDLAAGKYTQTMLKCRKIGEKSLFLISDGMRLVVRHSYGVIRVWDLATGLWQTIDLPDKRLRTMAISPCRTRLAWANKQDICVWDVASNEYRWASTSDAGRTNAMAFSPDDSRLALVTVDGTFKVWELTTSKPLQSLDSRPDAIMEMVYSPNGKWLASLTYNDIKLWNPTTSECVRTLRTSSNFTALEFSLDSLWLAAGDDRGTIHVYNAATGACHQTLTSVEYDDGDIGPKSKHSAQMSIDSVTFSSNSSTLASVGPGSRTRDGDQGFGYILKIWDLATGECLRAVTLSSRAMSYIGIGTLIFSPDNTQLGSILRNGIVIVWDASTGEHLQTLGGHEKPYSHLHFARSGDRKNTTTDEFAESLAKLSDYFSRTQGVEYSNKAPELTISKDNAWIQWKKEPKIGLPPEYRPKTFAAHEDYCAIATYAHQVLCFRFSF